MFLIAVSEDLGILLYCHVFYADERHMNLIVWYGYRKYIMKKQQYSCLENGEINFLSNLASDFIVK